MTAQRFFYLVLTTAVLAGISLAQETSGSASPSSVAKEEAKEGLTGGIPIPPDLVLIEGTWTALHIWTKDNTWKNARTVQVLKDKGSLFVIWTNNGGGDDPDWNRAINPQNLVEIGTTVTLHRKLGSGRVDGNGENAQTWEPRPPGGGIAISEAFSWIGVHEIRKPARRFDIARPA